MASYKPDAYPQLGDLRTYLVNQFNKIADAIAGVSSGGVGGIQTLALGGTGADLSATGGSHQVLKQFSVGGTITVGQLSLADILGSVTLANGGTGSDLSATGGAHQVLKQFSVGAAVTVGQLDLSDLTGSVTLANGGTGSNLSATGGIHQVLRQSTAGAAVTVSQLAFTDIGSTIATGQVSGAYGSITGVGTIASGTWGATKIGLAFGGTNADLSATGGTSQVLKQVSGGAAITVGQLAFTDISSTVGSAQLSGSYTGITGVGTLTVGTWSATAIGVSKGGTGADLSATGGASQVLKQATSGAAITVGQLAYSDISGTPPGSAISLVQGSNLTLTLSCYVVSDYYEISSGIFLELGSESVLEIG